jgi:serine/threonine-protein kinase MRCK
LYFSGVDLTGERRLRQLEALFLGGPIQGHGQSFSVETLLDVLLVLYDECCNSSLRREKTVSDFIEFGKVWLMNSQVEFSYSLVRSYFKQTSDQNCEILDVS